LTPIWGNNNRSRNELLFKSAESQQTFPIKLEHNVLVQQITQWLGYLGKVLDETPIEPSMSKKASDTFHIDRRR